MTPEEEDRADLLEALTQERFYAPRLPRPGGPEVITLAHVRTQLETYEIRRRLLNDALEPRRVTEKDRREGEASCPTTTM